MSKLQDAVLQGFLIFALATVVAHIQCVTAPLIESFSNTNSERALSPPVDAFVPRR